MVCLRFDGVRKDEMAVHGKEMGIQPGKVQRLV